MWLSISMRFKKKISLKDKDIEDYYNTNITNFKQEEEVKARHILIKVEDDKNDAEAKKKAEEISARIKNGENFEELAKKYSQEPGADKSGGDLGWFGRGRMVKPFEDKAFSMAEGEVSDLVKTNFGYHIIKVEGKRAEGTKPLSEVKSMIEQTMKREKAEAEALDKMTNIHKEVSFDKKDFAAAAKENGFELKTSNLFAKGGEIKGLGRSYKFIQKAFELKKDELSTPVSDYKYSMVMRLVDIKEPYYPEFKDVQDLVKNSYKSHLAEKAALEKAQNICNKLKSGTEWASFKEDKSVKTDVGIEISRRSKYIKGVGKIDNIIPLTFNMEAGAISDPINTKSGYMIFKVNSKEMFDEKKYNEKRAEILKNLIDTRQQQILEDYIKSLKENAKIENFLETSEKS